MKAVRKMRKNKGIIMLGPIFTIIVIAILVSITLNYWDDIAPNFQVILKYVGYGLLGLLGVVIIGGIYHMWQNRGKSRPF